MRREDAALSALWRGFLSLVDPLARISEAYALWNGQWTIIGTFVDQEPVAVEPSTALTLALADLWVEKG